MKINVQKKNMSKSAYLQKLRQRKKTVRKRKWAFAGTNLFYHQSTKKTVPGLCLLVHHQSPSIICMHLRGPITTLRTDSKTCCLTIDSLFSLPISSKIHRCVIYNHFFLVDRTFTEKPWLKQLNIARALVRKRVHCLTWHSFHPSACLSEGLQSTAWNTSFRVTSE